MNFDDIPTSRLVHLIDEWIHSERDRAIMKRRLVDGIIYDDLAYEFNLSVKQIKRIVYKCQDKLFRHM